MQWTHRLAELVEDWSYMFRQRGPRVALPVVLCEIARLPIWHCRYKVLARSLVEPLPTVWPRIAAEIRSFEPADLEMVRHIDRPSEVKQCAKRLALGHQGLIALYDGQPAGYAWCCMDCNPIVERVRLRLEPGDVLCVDAYTAPAFRGQGIQTALALARMHLFREQGYQRAIAYIETGNLPSLAVWHKVGSREVDLIDFLRIGPWRWTRYL